MNKRDMEKALEAEVLHWPGVELELLDGGKHPKARYTFEGNMLSHPYASTPSDAAFGIHRMLGDHRRILKRLGAVRDKPEPSKDEDEAPYRKPNDGAEKRPDPVAREKVAAEPGVAEKLAAAGVQASGSVQTYSKAAAAINDATEQIAHEAESDAEAQRAARLAELEGMIASIRDGIYFDLPEEVYHRVPALGGGAINKLIVSPGTFWRGSWLDPDRPEMDEEATKAQIIGRAYHCARLEPEKLEARFAGELDKKTMPPGSLFTGTQMAAALAARGLSKSGSVLEQAERLADDGFPIEKLWHVALHNWQRELGTRQKIDAKTWAEILIDMERIQSIPAIRDKLSGGAAEVAVFWTDEDGVRCKCKLDYLTVEHWAELKTFDNSRGKRLEQAIADAVRYNRYYVSAAHYRDGVEAIRTGGLQIRGPSTDAQRVLIARIQIKPTPLDLFMIFQEKGGIPNLLSRRFEFFNPTGSEEAIRQLEESGASDEHLAKARRFAEISDSVPSPTGIYRLAQAEIRKAKADFQLYSQVYDVGEPWAPIDPEGTIGDIDFNPYFLEGRG